LKSLNSLTSLSLCLYLAFAIIYLAGKSVEVGFFILFSQKYFAPKNNLKKIYKNHPSPSFQRGVH